MMQRHAPRLLAPQRRPDDPSGTQTQGKKYELVSRQTTKVTALSTKLEWKISEFERLMKLYKNGDNLISKTFGCPEAPSVIWELHVYPNGKREEDASNVSFFLRQVGLSRNDKPLMTEFQIYAVDSFNQRVSVCRDTKDFTHQQGRGKFQVTRDKLIAALRHDGTLVLFCELEYLLPEQGIETEVEGTVDDQKKQEEFFIREANYEMWTNKRFTDCCIKVGHTEIDCHRCILAQQSEVFRSMFQEEFREAREGVIEILDCKPGVVKKLLEFMYTGSFGASLFDATCTVEELLAIADKYAVLRLKEQCEFMLSKELNVKNFSQLASFADLYSAELLKRACTRFLVGHHKTVMRSPDWRELKKSNPGLANELLESALNVGEPLGNSMDELDDSNDEIEPPPRKRLRRFGNNAPGQGDSSASQ